MGLRAELSPMVKARYRGKLGKADAQREERQAVGAFWVAPVQNSQSRAFKQAHTRPSGKMWPVAPRGRDLSHTTSSSVRAR